MTDFVETDPPFHQEIEALGANAPSFPEISLEVLSTFSWQELHELGKRQLQKYKDEHKDQEELIEKTKYLVLGFLAMDRPGFLLGEGASDEERVEFAQISAILEHAAFQAGSPNVSPIYRAAIYSNIRLMEKFAEAHGRDPQASRIRGALNGVKANLAVDKTLAGRCRLLAADPLTDPQGFFTMTVKERINKIAIPRSNPDVALAVTSRGDREMTQDYLAPEPRPYQFSGRLLDSLEPRMEEELTNMNVYGTVLRTYITYSTRLGVLPGLDPDLPQGEAMLGFARPHDANIRGIMRVVDNKLAQ